jgi:putative ATPase
MADPTALQTAVAAMHAVAQIGMPEARIILAQAVVHNAMAPKSNAAYLGVNAAIADVRAGRGGAVPAHLRGSGYAGAERLGHGGATCTPTTLPTGSRSSSTSPTTSRRPGDLLPPHRPGFRGASAHPSPMARGTVGAQAH